MDFTGVSGSGKSTLCKAVAEHFNVPHLTLTKDNLDSMASQLGSKVCRYRGYVLDAGYVGFEEAERLFRYDVEVPLTEEEEAGLGTGLGVGIVLIFLLIAYVIYQRRRAEAMKQRLAAEMDGEMLEVQGLMGQEVQEIGRAHV